MKQKFKSHAEVIPHPVRKGIGFRPVRFILLLACLFVLLLIASARTIPNVAAQADECTYYLSKTGSDLNSGISEIQAWSTFSYALNQLRPGDTLCISDETYFQSMVISISGTEANPITIKALHDGEVIVDGQKERRPLNLYGDYIVIEGLVFQWSSRDVVQISGDHNILRRVSAYHSRWDEDNTEHAVNYNTHAVVVTGTHNLIEDCVAAGAERHLFIDFNSQGRSQENIFRRNFATCTEFGGCRSEFNFYGSSDSICENCIGWGESIAKSISVHSATWEDAYACRGNKILGSMFLRSKVYGLTTGYGYADENNTFENILLYGNNYGLRLYHSDGGGSNETVKNITIIGSQHPAIIVDTGNTGSTIVNTLLYSNPSAFSGSADYMSHINAYENGNNEIPNCTEGCLSVDPGFDPYPARLIIPDDSPMNDAGKNGEDIGANICYRYENGILTDEPLWPWPMADRIEKELGIDIMQDLEQLFGPIPAECKGEGPDVFSASITADPSSGPPPLSVVFNSVVSNSTPPYSYSWSFGDGQTSNQVNPTHTYTQYGTFTASLTVTDSQNDQAHDTVIIQVMDPTQVLSIKDIQFTLPNQTQEVNRLEPDTWYDLYLHFNTPNAWQEIAFADIWLSAPSYTEGSIANRGGTHYSASNYVLSYSIASDQIWSKETEGSSEWIDITGRLGRYVDDDNHEYEQNSSQGWAKARMKLLNDAEPGTWSIYAYVKAEDGDIPELYAEEINVQAWLKEDINLDGSVNSLDIQLCVNVVIGWETDADIAKRADVNNDGIVKPSDIQQILSKIWEP